MAEEKHKSAVEKEEALVIQKQEIIENKEDAELALAEAMPRKVGHQFTPKDRVAG